MKRRLVLIKKAASGNLSPVITISAQPTNQSTSDGNASFSVTASVTEGATLSYQWQRSTDAGTTFSALSGETSNSLSLSSITVLSDQYQYRCVVSATGGAASVNSSSATLSVVPAITVSAQPQASTTSEALGTSSFSVTASASVGGTISYQWQRSTDGTSFSNLSGETNSSLSLSSLTYATNNQNQYRCVVSGNYNASSVTSSAAVLTVYDSTTAMATWTSATLSGSYGGLTYAKELGLFVAVGGSTTRASVSNDGTNWSDTTGAVVNLQTVAWSPELGMFAAVGNIGGIATSYDGYNWTQRTSPTTNNLKRVRWIPEKGFFLACSTAVSASNKFVKSTDGITWTGFSGPSTEAVYDFDYAPSLNSFFALGYSSNKIFTSSDGETWTTSASTMPSSGTWYAIKWSSQKSLFVAGAWDGGYLATSPDGANWTTRTKVDTTQSGVTAIDYSPELGYFAMSINGNAGYNRVHISPDGINWTGKISSSAANWDVCWSSDVGKFVCIGGSGFTATSTSVYSASNVIKLTAFTLPSTYRNDTASSSYIATASIASGSISYQWEKSTNSGVSFSSVAGATAGTLTLTQTERNAAVDGSHFYRLKMTSATAKYSPVYAGYFVPSANDAIYYVSNWSSSSLTNQNWYSICYAKELGLFVAVSSTGTNRIAVSNNGTTWTELTGQAASAYALNYVAWSPTLGMFVAVGSSGSIFTSYDGYNWTQRTSPTTSNQLYTVKWIAEKSFFLITSNSAGTANKILKSTDGITWTGYSSLSTTALSDFDYSPSLDLIVVQVYGASNFITSSDGQNWSSVSVGSGTNRNWDGIKWSASQGKFVATSSNSNSVATSTDGTNWTIVSTGVSLNKIDYSPEFNLYVSNTVNTGGSTKVWSSPDGVTWTARGPSLGTSVTFRNILWVPDYKKFYAISQDGAQLTSATVSDPENVIKLSSFSLPTITYRNNTANTTYVTTSTIASGSISYQWQLSTNSGSTFSDVAGATSSTLTLSQADRNAALDAGNYVYRLKMTSATAKYSPVYAGYYDARVQENNIYALNNYNLGSISDSSWAGLVWSSKRGVFVTASFSGNDKIAVSANGLNWQYVNTDTSGATITPGNAELVYSEEKDLFVQSGPSSYVYTSTDGLNWTQRASSTTQTLASGAYSPSLGLFVYVSRTATSNVVVTSSNGTTWSNSSTGVSQAMWGVAWSPTLGLFAAVGDNGTIITSTNGTSWTTRTSPNTNAYKSIAWSPTLGMFAAVSNGGTNRVMTSTDGITWTARTSAAETYAWRRIIWVSDLGMFVAGSESTGVSCVMYSANGTSWTLSAINNRSTTSSVTGLAWSSELKRLGQVGFYGTGVRNYATADIYTNKTTVAGFTALPKLTTTNYLSSTADVTLSSTALVSDGSSPSYQWQRSSDNGSTWADLSEKTSANLVLTDAESETASTSNYKYRVKVLNGTNNLISTTFSVVVQSDGVYAVNNWTVSSPGDRYWCGVAWSPKLGLFAAVSYADASSATTLQRVRIGISKDGVNWTYPTYWSTSGFFPNDILWVGGSVNMFVVVGQVCILTSPDGINWTSRKNTNMLIWETAAYSSTQGIVAVFNGTYAANAVLKSTNGITWTTSAGLGFTQAMWGIAWSPSLSLFVMVGAGGRIMSSPDGTTWTQRTSNTTNTLTSIAWSPELSLFVAVANTGTSRVVTSPDGINWTTRTSAAETYSWRKVIWVSDLGLFIAGAQTTVANNLMYSSDGINWSIASMSPSATAAWRVPMAWSPELKRLLVLSQSTTQNAVGTAALSADIFAGKTSYMSITAAPSNYETWLDNTASTTLTAAASVSTGATPSYQWQRSSDNGTNWSDLAGQTSTSLVLTDAETETASTNSYKYRFSASSAGISNSPVVSDKVSLTVRSTTKDYCVENWTMYSAANSNQLRSVVWAPSLSLFCAIGDSGTNNRAQTSPDGITWTVRTTPSAANNNWQGLAWSPELSLFVAVAGSGTNNRVMTSPDGIAWTARTSAQDNNWTSVCWSPTANGTGLFVAVSNGGTNRVMTSPDGINWTVRTSSITTYCVCWSAEVGLFVAAGFNSMATSPDGINWTLRNPAAIAAGAFVSVCWSKELGLFCAFPSATSNGKVVTSPDGINWTARMSQQDVFFQSQFFGNGIAWSPGVGRFVQVGLYANMSAIVSNVYMATPAFSLAAGTYTGTQSVTLSVANSGATIYYTTDGSTPTTSSTVYSGAISVPSSRTIKAIAVKSGYPDSTIASAAYTIN